jgi:membrane fusion protein (multidrug efflux system)
MKKSIIKFSLPLFLVALLTACGGAEEQSSLDKLIEKKKKLRAELLEVQEQISALEKNQGSGVIPLVTLSPVENKTFVHKIIVQGNVETDQDVLINAEMGGTITQVHVKEGQRVSAGQVLVSLDASILSSNMKELETQLEYAEYMLQKQEELKRRGVGSEFDYKTAKNQVDGLKSKMKSLGTQRGKSTIKAPFSGVVDKIFAKNGQLAGPQAPLLRLVNNNEIRIAADISEKHLRNIEAGTKMLVRFPNYKDTAVPMTVQTLGNYIDPTNRTFRIMSTLKNNKLFLPNMLAELEIEDINEPNSMVIPSKSIMKSQLNEDFVYVATSKGNNQFSLRKVIVEVVEKYNGEAMIRLLNDSIKVGELIVVEGARGISEKDIVRNK